MQPRDGHRAGLEAMLLAATLAADATGHLADLGAGSGAAGLAAASRLPDLKVLLVERSGIMADLARSSLALPQNHHLMTRTDVLQADVTLRGNARQDAGLADNAFDHVLTNPPFNDARDRATPDPLKAEAHLMSASLWEDWLRTAGAILKPGGSVALIARPESMASLLPAAEKRFGSLRLLALHPHQGEAAIRIILRGIKGSRARLSIGPPLVLHQPDGALTSVADDLINGRSSMDI